VAQPAIDWSAPDPELGGFRPGTPQHIPSRFRSDEFYRGRFSSTNRPASEEDEEQVLASLQARFLASARNESWLECVVVARKLVRDSRKTSDRAESLYALGLANEMANNVAEAMENYTAALRIDQGHAKAARRLAGLKS
jgi:hypothetical protein